MPRMITLILYITWALQHTIVHHTEQFITLYLASTLSKRPCLVVLLAAIV